MYTTDACLQVNYAKMNNLAGAMLYTLDMDDFSNTCGDGNFPLMSAVSDQLAEGGPVASDTQEPWGGPIDSSVGKAQLAVAVVCFYMSPDTTSVKYR